MRQRSAFTLVELLVVAAIIAAVSALLISLTGVLRGSSKELLTTHRMNQVLNGLEQYTTEGDLIERLQLAGGLDRRFSNLRGIIGLLTQEYGTDIRTMERDEHLPPRIGNRWQNAIHRDTLRDLTGSSSSAISWIEKDLNDSTKAAWALECRKKWPDPNTDIDSVILFYDRQVSLSSSSGSTNSRITVAYPNLVTFTKLSTASSSFFMLEAWDDITRDAYGGSYGSTVPGMAGEFLPKRGRKSAVGETLDGTREIRPDQVRPSSWYYSQWPNLVETIGPDSNNTPTFSHVAWPDSDWNDSVPGSVPVVWPWPWGKQIFSRIEGGLLSQIEYRVDSNGDLIDRTLADLSPLRTIDLLQAAGVVPGTDEGRDSYRQNRSPGKNWNDAWGSPLVVACAHYLPARYDFDDVNDTMLHQELGKQIPKMSRDALGGRDYFMTKADETYGYHRSFYATVGATGGLHGGIIPGDWQAADDDETLRSLWVEITQVTRANEWTGASFDSPPWSGLRSIDHEGAAMHVLSPKEFR
jgi:prepilin-type N-terminal cleavage/methylation domain-containing protein